MKQLLNIDNLDYKDLQDLINRTLIHSRKNSPKTLKDKRVGLIFSEVSLRTQISFTIAVQLLGGISTMITIPHFTTEFDGTPREDICDILRSLEGWMDIFIIRDYSGQILKEALQNIRLPIIDGFCGDNHPTQTIADLGIIKNESGKIQDVEICCVCPNFGSGVMESFALGAVMMGARVIFLISGGEYKPKNKDFFIRLNKIKRECKGKLAITNNHIEALKNAEFLYVDEWWKNSKNFLDIEMNELKVDNDFLKNAPKNIKVMHYLPAHHEREISKQVLYSDFSIAFKQAEFRLYSAMASLEYVHKII